VYHKNIIMMSIQSKFTIITGLFAAAIFFTACNSNQSSDKNSDTSIAAYTSPDTVQSVVHDTVVVTKPSTVPKSTPATAVAPAPAQPVAPATDKVVAPKRKGRVMVELAPVVKNAPIKKDNYGVYDYPQIYPTFPGGQLGIERYVVNHIDYPQAALDYNKEGKVGVTFVVDENGRIRNAHLAGNKLGRGLDEEAIRVVSSMPHWNPGIVNGHPVKTRVTLPIIFQIEG
jgi:periplasmic protein TonB